MKHSHVLYETFCIVITNEGHGARRIRQLSRGGREGTQSKELVRRDADLFFKGLQKAKISWLKYLALKLFAPGFAQKPLAAGGNYP